MAEKIRGKRKRSLTGCQQVFLPLDLAFSKLPFSPHMQKYKKLWVLILRGQVFFTQLPPPFFLDGGRERWNINITSGLCIALYICVCVCVFLTYSVVIMFFIEIIKSIINVSPYYRQTDNS